MYSDYIKINENFKSSINLSYDVGDEEKIKNYVLTSSLTECIEKYVDNVINNKNNATYIEGPYGKGKSYLFLVLTYIFNKKNNKAIFDDFKKRIAVFNKSLSKKIDKIDKEKLFLLPIFVNTSVNNSLHDNFITALNTALERNNINNDIEIPTSFSLAIKYIEKWEKDSENIEILDKCKKKLGITLKVLKRELSKNNSVYLSKFKDLFFCITHGVHFNPWYEEDFSKIYLETANNIYDKYGYKGFFVIYDEFGTFLNTSSNNFASELKSIQTFAEMSKSIINSKKNKAEIHFTLIAHKDLSLYNNDSKLTDTFQTIKERFEKYDFTRSFEDDFTSILSSRSIINSKEYNKNNLLHNALYKRLLETGFIKVDEKDLLVKEAFPFNPITLKLLVIVSRLLGQNERTMFTFMASKSINTFYDFITHNDNKLIDVDYIFSYFSDSLNYAKEYEELNFFIINALKLCKTEIERRIIKVLAILKIVNDRTIIKCDRYGIALSLSCCNESENVPIFEAINKLIDRGIIKESIIDNELDFLPLLSEELHTKLLRTSSNITTVDNLLSSLSSINRTKYIVSNEYNFEYKMTRFFEVIFYSYSKIKEISDFSNIIKSYNCDGLIINIYNDKDEDIDIVALNKRRQDVPILFNTLKCKFNESFLYKVDLIDKIGKLLKSTSKLTDSEKTSLETYNIILKNDVCSFLSKQINVNKGELYTLLKDYYKKTITFNNEQVNRNLLSKTTEITRNIICDKILEGKEEEIETQKGQSQEYTVFKSYKKAIGTNGATDLVNEILNIIKNNNKTKIEFSEIKSLLKDGRYGMRDGIIPFFIVKALASISLNDKNNFNTIFLYNKNKEVPLNTENIVKGLNNENDFYFFITEINKDKIKCVDDLLMLFNKDKEALTCSFKNKLYMVVNCIQKYIYSLPHVCLQSREKDNILSLSKKAIDFINLFSKNDLNAYDTIFVKLVKILNVDILDIKNEIVSLQNEYKEKFNSLINDEIEFIIKTLGTKSNSIKGAFDLYYAKKKQIENVVLENDNINILQALKDSSSYDDKECINNLSSSVLNTTLDDWNAQKKDKFENSIKAFVQRIKEYKKDGNGDTQNDKEQLSQLGTTFYNNLISIIEEYNNAISNKEKVLALQLALKEIKGK